MKLWKFPSRATNSCYKAVSISQQKVKARFHLYKADKRKKLLTPRNEQLRPTQICQILIRILHSANQVNCSFELLNQSQREFRRLMCIQLLIKASILLWTLWLTAPLTIQILNKDSQTAYHNRNCKFWLQKNKKSRFVLCEKPKQLHQHSNNLKYRKYKSRWKSNSKRLNIRKILSN